MSIHSRIQVVIMCRNPTVVPPSQFSVTIIIHTEYDNCMIRSTIHHLLSPQNPNQENDPPNDPMIVNTLENVQVSLFLRYQDLNERKQEPTLLQYRILFLETFFCNWYHHFVSYLPTSSTNMNSLLRFIFFFATFVVTASAQKQLRGGGQHLQTNIDVHRKLQDVTGTQRFEQLRDLLLSLEGDFEKFYDKDNDAAGTRVRKGMQELKTLASDIRKEVKAIKNSNNRKLELEQTEQGRRKLAQRFEELRDLVLSLEGDFIKFYDQDNDAAGTRLRKGMKEVKALARDIRKEVRQIQNGGTP